MPDNRTKIIFGTAVAVGTVAAGLAYLYYLKKVDEPIPKKWKKVGQVRDLYCFPLKSCAPIKSASFDCHLLGLKYEGVFDRCFIVSRKNQQTTARVYPKMVLIQPNVVDNKLILSTPNKQDFVLNLDTLRNRSISEKVECWYAKVDGIDAGDDASNWLSEYITGKLGEFRLVFYPYEHPTKGVGMDDRIYKAYKDADAGSYHDKTSYMLINQASIDEMNSHLDHVVKPLQFRPNIVVSRPGAYEEDDWKWVRIGDNVIYRVLKPCTRCIFTNINPETGTRHPNKQPFKTLVKNRTIIKGATPVMGTQMGIRVCGKISIGDDVYVNDDS